MVAFPVEDKHSPSTRLEENLLANPMVAVFHTPDIASPHHFIYNRCPSNGTGSYLSRMIKAGVAQ